MIPKADGSYRMILNLKDFNENAEYEHFKMENLQSATRMMTQGCYMASVDLRHAYYSVSLDEECRKFLKFSWKDQLFQFTCFPNGLASCPRYFTKLMKPVFASLRQQGLLSAAYIDDSYLQGADREECQKNIEQTLHTLRSLGFVIHESKSVFEPTTKVKYLGFWLDSQEMKVTLPDERVKKLKTACLGLKKKKVASIREVAQVIGQLVAAFPAVQWGPLYYRHLEKDKTQALKTSKGNFEAKMMLSQEGKIELQWWIDNVETAYFPLVRKDPSIEIRTDASTSGGWGAVSGPNQTGGRWSQKEQKLHINVLELMAIEFAI